MSGAGTPFRSIQRSPRYTVVLGGLGEKRGHVPYGLKELVHDVGVATGRNVRAGLNDLGVRPFHEVLLQLNGVLDEGVVEHLCWDQLQLGVEVCNLIAGQ